MQAVQPHRIAGCMLKVFDRFNVLHAQENIESKTAAREVRQTHIMSIWAAGSGV